MVGGSSRSSSSTNNSTSTSNSNMFLCLSMITVDILVGVHGGNEEATEEGNTLRLHLAPTHRSLRLHIMK